MNPIRRSACCAPAHAQHDDTRSAEWTYRPNADVVETNDALSIIADLPGADANAITVTVEQGVLSVNAKVPDRYDGRTEFGLREFGIGAYHRRFRLDDRIDSDAISGRFEHGVLTLTLPKLADSTRRRVPVLTPSDN